MFERKTRSGGHARRIGGLAIATVLVVGLTATDTGAANLDNGAGTKAALDNPKCDPELERIKFVYQGWVPCVKAWEAGADNGGATSPGVTADTIKVVVLKPPDQTTQESRSPIRNRATGQFATVEDSVRDTLPIFERTYEQWGRKVEVEVVESAGTDETAQRADAVKVAALKPFAVIDFTEGAVFGSDLARQKIMVVGGAFPNRAALEQAPYRWPITIDMSANALLGAELDRQDPGRQARDSSPATRRPRSRSACSGRCAPTSATAHDYEPALAELEKHGGRSRRTSPTPRRSTRASSRPRPRRWRPPSSPGSRTPG